METLQLLFSHNEVAQRLPFDMLRYIRLQLFDQIIYILRFVSRRMNQLTRELSITRNASDFCCSRPLLQWAKDRGCDVNRSLSKYIVIHRNIDGLEWFREQNREWSDFAMEYAADLGRLEMIQWLHDRGVYRDSTAFYPAVTPGSVLMLLDGFMNTTIHHRNLLLLRGYSDDGIA